MQKPLPDWGQSGSKILDRGKTPGQWSQIVAAHGIELSERMIRERAHKFKACYGRGKSMIITPEQFDEILEASCHSNSTDAVAAVIARAPKNLSDIS